MRLSITVPPAARERITESWNDNPAAVLDLVHRMACEAAELCALGHPKSREFMERDSGQTGWRAYASPETLAAVEALEALGVEFVDGET